MSQTLAVQLERFAHRTVARVVDEAIGGNIMKTLPSVSNWVYLVEGRDGTQHVAKYGMLGHSRGTVESVGAKHGFNEVVKRQRAYVGGGTRLGAEHEILSILDVSSPGRFSRPSVYCDGVLVLHFIPGETLAERLDATEDPDVIARLLERAARAIDDVHATPLRTELREAMGDVAVEALRSDIRQTFERKFLPGTPHERVALKFGWDRSTLGRLRSTMGRLEFPPEVLVVGDAKPDHVILATGKRTLFIDASPHLASPVVDHARFGARSALALRCRVGDATAWALDDVIERRTVAGSARATAMLIVADLLNIVTTYVAMRPALLAAQPRHVQRTAADAKRILSACAEACANILDDPETEREERRILLIRLFR